MSFIRHFDFFFDDSKQNACFKIKHIPTTFFNSLSFRCCTVNLYCACMSRFFLKYFFMIKSNFGKKGNMLACSHENPSTVSYTYLKLKHNKKKTAAGCNSQSSKMNVYVCLFYVCRFTFFEFNFYFGFFMLHFWLLLSLFYVFIFLCD